MHKPQTLNPKPYPGSHAQMYQQPGLQAPLQQQVPPAPSLTGFFVCAFADRRSLQQQATQEV